MVTTAAASLWLTRQLDAWAVAAQAAALLVSLALRTRPHAWQRSPIALNLGMFAIVAGTIQVALRGEPSTIALAHFAATTQGLQLLDARPRRTEFLLVALALFQVVLAANLTDSVFFTPLLVAFLFATVWTLLVHTLRSEAGEAGVAGEVPRALTPGLLRTTTFACGVTLAIAALLFVLLPRLRTSVLTGPGMGALAATAGFSDRVEFGALGRIRQDPRVVLRVETLEGSVPSVEQAYWRGLAFDTFDGTSWSITPPDRVLVPGSAEGGIGLGRAPDEVDLVQRIVREPVAAGVLFSVGEPRGIQGTVRRLERDHSGGLYAAGQDDERIRYTVRSKLRATGAGAPPDARAVPPERSGDRYLKLPPVSPAFIELAQRITAGHAGDAARVRAIESHLLTHGRYSDTPPPGDPASPLSPVERFALGEMAGHCEYFASAMVLLARAAGLPARLVNGFAGGRENSIGGFVELSHSDAHAWVEVHYEGAGWLRYDPTPADLRARADAGASLSLRLRELASALELWWFQRVVGFDRADQISALRRAWLAWHTRGEAHERGAEPAHSARRGDFEAPWREGVLVAACAGAAAVLAAGALRRARTGRRLPPAYAASLRLLARRGLVRAPAATARGFAREVTARVSPRAADAFHALTEGYLAERFGGAAPREAERHLAALRAALRAERTRARGALTRG
jgi:transglutaminase-like putative cysteine protease